MRWPGQRTVARVLSRECTSAADRRDDVSVPMYADGGASRRHVRIRRQKPRVRQRSLLMLLRSGSSRLWQSADANNAEVIGASARPGKWGVPLVGSATLTLVLKGESGLLFGSRRVPTSDAAA